MDYLNRQRYIPRADRTSKQKRKEEVEKRLCQTCIHYDFYYCKALQKDTAPEKTCMDNRLYISRFGRGDVKNGVTMEE